MHTGFRWRFIFLSGKSDLSNEERLKVVSIAADMYLGGAKERQISIDRYRGLLYTKSEWSVLELQFAHVRLL
jgi:hypothetical protein